MRQTGGTRGDRASFGAIIGNLSVGLDANLLYLRPVDPISGTGRFLSELTSGMGSANLS